MKARGFVMSVLATVISACSMAPTSPSPDQVAVRVELAKTTLLTTELMLKKHYKDGEISEDRYMGALRVIESAHDVLGQMGRCMQDQTLCLIMGADYSTPEARIALINRVLSEVNAQLEEEK